MTNNLPLAENEAEKRFFAPKEIPVKAHKTAEIEEANTALAREDVTKALELIGIGTSGEKYVSVEEDGSLSFNRNFMIHALKEKGVEVLPKMSDEDVANKFNEVVGDELKFFIGDAKIQTKGLPKPSAKTKLPGDIELPKAA